MTTPFDPTSEQTGGLQSMLARLRGMMQALRPPDAEPLPGEEILPTWDGPPPTGEPQVVVAAPAGPEPAGLEPARPESAGHHEPSPELPTPAPSAPPRLCPSCGAVRGLESYCDSCGYIFPAEAECRTEAPSPEAGPRLHGRYILGEQLGERGGVTRFQALDGSADPVVPVIVIRMALPPTAEPVSEAAPDAGGLPESPVSTVLLPPLPGWPSVDWERALLETVQHPALPAVVESFTEEGFAYLVEEVPTGRPLWDAWDDPASTAGQRFGWLKQIAEALQALHRCHALLEGLRPDTLVVTSDGVARITDVADLLPLAVPADAPIRATFYTAPELMTAPESVDSRSDLYSFGAMLYALYVGHELTDLDFEGPGFPKPFLPQFPDVHPLFGRLIAKTFRREPPARFPTDEAAREDATGFTELISVLEACGRTLDQCRLEVAAWTTTGMVRTGNEDAFALLHAALARQDELEESALILVADGMGGCEAGEIAAAMAVQTVRAHLLGKTLFRSLIGEPASDPNGFDVALCQELIRDALREANKQVYAAARAPGGRGNMGCTAEVVYLSGRHVVVGHVGDSRTYHLHEGRLIQLTRDQTLVNRLVELGTLTSEEAEEHPRRNELQQAVGGQPDVEVALYVGDLKPGDWVIVCSDGLGNHVKPELLKQMLQGEATSAEMAARRLVNLVNLEGATDNATVVVVRAT